MYRVELKASSNSLLYAYLVAFLMYRVELKVYLNSSIENDSLVVPNVPCGVERFIRGRRFTPGTLFLMYRVELKAKSTSC